MKPRNTFEFPLLFAAWLQIDVSQSNADDLSSLTIHALERVLNTTLVPIVEGASRMSCPELFRIYKTSRKQNLQKNLTHLVMLESGEVDIVESPDVRNQGRENNENHLG